MIADSVFNKNDFEQIRVIFYDNKSNTKDFFKNKEAMK